jgi:hypothetical protein
MYCIYWHSIVLRYLLGFIVLEYMSTWNHARFEPISMVSIQHISTLRPLLLLFYLPTNHNHKLPEHLDLFGALRRMRNRWQTLLHVGGSASQINLVSVVFAILSFCHPMICWEHNSWLVNTQTSRPAHHGQITS